MIYIVRHGETNYNVEGRYAGRIDVPLNDNGIKQAYLIKEKLKDIKFDKVFSSPLKRAYETATIICGDKYNIIKDDRLIERSNGELEGRLKKEIKEYIDFNDINENRFDIENIVDFRKRVKEYIDYILDNYRGKNILIVTHAGVCIYARCYFEGDPQNGDYSKYKIKNCEVLEYENNTLHY